jgi:anhydro-N-acetylmuramic acid kinase
MRVVGLMSGTSLDGIDAVLVEISSQGAGGDGAGNEPPAGLEAPDWRLLAFVTVPHPPDRRRAIHETILRGYPESLARLHVDLGEAFAGAVEAVCRAADVALSDVAVIGSHGQTVWHRPPSAAGDPDGPGRRRGFTLQLGDPATIAERTGIPVVSDFRARDMAAGGEGAPLVPWVDRLLFAGEDVRVLLNIGGMANVTRVPPRGSQGPVVAFDTGPGNAIIDAAVELATGGARQYDADGEWARRGRVDEGLVARLLEDPFFTLPPPRSTGRERFGLGYVEAIVEACQPSDDAGWADLVASLTAVVARSIGAAVRQWAPPGREGVVVTGGGAENPVLMERLEAELGPAPVRHGRVLGIDPACKEALAFAVLAWAHVNGRSGSLPSATGATGPRVLGSLTPGAGGRLPASMR